MVERQTHTLKVESSILSPGKISNLNKELKLMTEDVRDTIEKIKELLNEQKGIKTEENPFKDLFGNIFKPQN